MELFVEALRDTPECAFAWAWGSGAGPGSTKGSAKNRTSLYRNGVLPRVAQRLGLIDAYELFRVDSTFCVGDSLQTRETLVPIIHVESENRAKDAGHEVRKLCSLTSRLKVLISCDEWSGVWRHGGNAKSYLAQWRALVRNHHLYHPDDCEMGVIVAERRNVGGTAEAVDFYATTLTSPNLTEPVTGNPIHTRPLYRVAPRDPGYSPAPKQASDFDSEPGSRD
jgi:hypothetical protein